MQKYKLLLGAGSLIVMVMITGYFIVFGKDQFAQSFFKEKVEIEKILSSQGDHFGAMGCTYAAVKFTQKTVQALQQNGPFQRANKNTAERQVYFSWYANGRWHQTPRRLNHPKDKKTWHKPFRCLHQLPGHLKTLMQDELSKEGNWYFEHEKDAGLISLNHNIAVMLRFGE